MITVDQILNKALRGARLNLEDSVTLFESEEIEKIGHAADIMMKRKHPDPITTFVIMAFQGYQVSMYEFCGTLLIIFALLRNNLYQRKTQRNILIEVPKAVPTTTTAKEDRMKAASS